MTNELTIQNKELAALYQDSLGAGTEDAGESNVYPMVKITAALSKENILANGKKSDIGKLYHTELKKDFNQIEANICYVGKFMLPDFTTKELKQTYVVGAVMTDNSPFVMYVKGYSLQNMWQFIGEVANIRGRFHVPMYALKVAIESVERAHEKFGSVNVFKFSIQRDKNSAPFVEMDIDRAQSLRDLTDKFKEVIALMNNKEAEVDEYADSLSKDGNEAFIGSTDAESSRVEDVADAFEESQK